THAFAIEGCFGSEIARIKFQIQRVDDQARKLAFLWGQCPQNNCHCLNFLRYLLSRRRVSYNDPADNMGGLPMIALFIAMFRALSQVMANKSSGVSIKRN